MEAAQPLTSAMADLKDDKPSCNPDHGCGCDTPSVRVDAPVGRPASTLGGQTFKIPTMDCPVEEAQIRRALEPISGIRSMQFQLAARTLSINAPADVVAQALVAIRKEGFEAQLLQPRGSDPSAHDHAHGQSGGWARLGAALLIALSVELLDLWAPENDYWHVTGMLLALVAIGLSGLATYQKGLLALRAGQLNINALMTVAVTGAFIIGEWPEAAMVMSLYAMAEWIEAKSVDRARHAIQSLLDLTPKEAVVKTADGQWASMPSSDVAVGSVVKVRPGERIPLDGVVVAGAGAVNQAPVTGESMPVDKTAGDLLFAGTVNETGELHFRTTALATDTTLAHIIEAVERAQHSRAPTQRFVDRFAQVYTPAVFVVAVAVALFSPALLGVTWLQGIYQALVLLVIACPCALVISTPVTVVSALAAAARRGILVKGGAYLEQARHIRVVAMDKTGTLTVGRPALVDWHPLPVDDEEARPWVAQMAASLAVRSDHPVSQAIGQGLQAQALDVDDFEAMPGLGVQGQVNGYGLVLGNHGLIERRGQCSQYLESVLDQHQAAGRTVTMLASNEGVHGVFAVADRMKADAPDAVQQLKSLGVDSVLLSGDNDVVVRQVAQQAGMGAHRGQLMPQDKLNELNALRQSHGVVAMVGDGINDAPALAQADIGIAMGVIGTDTAVEAADVVIMNDDLRRVPELIRLSQRTHVVLWQNIALALGIKAVFLVMAVSGYATMWMAVFADMGASLIVVANGLRMLRSNRV